MVSDAKHLQNENVQIRRYSVEKTGYPDTYLTGVDVVARRVDVRVVREDDVGRRARNLRDAEARVARDDDVRDLAVLARNAEAELLPGEQVRAVRVDDPRVHLRQLEPAGVLALYGSEGG